MTDRNRVRGWMVRVALAVALLAPAVASAHEPVDAEITRLREHLQAHPDDVATALAHVDALLADERGEEAAEALRALRGPQAAAPFAVEIDRRMAEALVMEGRFDEALRHLEGLVEIGQASARTHELIGRIAMAASDHQRAAAAFAASLAEAPSVEVVLARAEALDALGEGPTALEVLEQHVVALDGAVVLREAIIERATRQGEPERAIAQLDAIIAHARVAVPWRLARASLLEQLGREEAAFEERQRALADADRQVERRGSPVAFRLRAEVLLALGYLTEAEADRQRATRDRALTGGQP